MNCLISRTTRIVATTFAATGAMLLVAVGGAGASDGDGKKTVCKNHCPTVLFKANASVAKAGLPSSNGNGTNIIYVRGEAQQISHSHGGSTISSPSTAPVEKDDSWW